MGAFRGFLMVDVLTTCREAGRCESLLSRRVAALLLALATVISLTVHTHSTAAAHVYDDDAPTAPFEASPVDPSSDQGVRDRPSMPGGFHRTYDDHPAHLARAFARPGEYPSAPNTAGLADDVAMGGRRLPFNDPDRVSGINSVLDDIDAGGPFPFRQDGTIFRNAEGRLPEQSPGYYREYTVPTPGAANRGTRRLVVGQNGEVYYTDNHYGSFTQIDPRSYP